MLSGARVNHLRRRCGLQLYGVVNATTITATLPYLLGFHYVLVTTPAGTTAKAAGDGFTTNPGPTITSLSPTPGSNPAGGQCDHHFRTALSGATSITDGGLTPSPTLRWAMRPRSSATLAYLLGLHYAISRADTQRVPLPRRRGTGSPPTRVRRSPRCPLTWVRTRRGPR